MTIITEVRFAHDDGALAGALAALPGLDVTVASETSTDPGGSYHFRLDHDGPESVRSALEADHTVRAVSLLRESGNSHLWSVEFEPGTELLAPLVTAERGFVLEAHSTPAGSNIDPRGWHERWLLPDREALHTIWQHARDAGFAFDVVELHRHGRTDTDYPGPDALTDEQQEALVAAYEGGYFAEPRETSLAELAESLDISASAVRGRINRGLRALVGAGLVTNRPEAGTPSDAE
jgi:Predicted DNA binding protein